MNLKLKSFIAIVDLVACSLEKMLSDKIKIQIIFFLKRRYSIKYLHQHNSRCKSLCYLYIQILLVPISIVKTLNKSEENPTGHLRQIQPFKTLTYCHNGI